MEYQPVARAVDVVTTLELELQTAQRRRDPDWLREILAEDFTEIGSSGRAWNRTSIIDLLASEIDEAPIEVASIEGRIVGDGYVLTQWVSIRDGRRVRRSSLWRLGRRGWQLVHHQGTPME